MLPYGPYRHIKESDLEPPMSEQLAILRQRIRDFEFRIEELDKQRHLTNADERLRLSLQAQIQDDRKKLRETTGEL